MKAYIHIKALRVDGSFDSFATIGVECKEAPLWWQEQRLNYTASGYGKRIPTQYMVRFNGRWRRVYCYMFSNVGTLYIGKLDAENVCTVQIEC